MKKLILTAMLLTACSTEDNAADNAAAPNDTKLQSIAVANFNKIPDCTKDNETQVAYVRDEKQWYVCESDWVAIDAPVNTKTLKGTDGLDGASGSDGQTVTTNNWYDAVTSKLWLVGSIGSYSAAEAACIGVWRLPTKDEALAAAQRGLGVAAVGIGGPSTMWTTTPWDSNPTLNNWIIQAIDTTPALWSANWSTDSKGIYCIEN